MPREPATEKPSQLNRDTTVGLLRQHGIQPTLQRIEIASILLCKAQHCSADGLLSLVNQVTPLVSKATVYNTLRLFAEKGLIREVLVDPTKVFFDSNTAPHQHFYNIDSGVLTDVTVSELTLQHVPEPPSGTQLVDVDVVIRVRAAG